MGRLLIRGGLQIRELNGNPKQGTPRIQSEYIRNLPTRVFIFYFIPTILLKFRVPITVPLRSGHASQKLMPRSSLVSVVSFFLFSISLRSHVL